MYQTANLESANLVVFDNTVNYNQIEIQEKLTIRYLESNNMVVAKGRSTGLEVLKVYTDMIKNVKDHLHKYGRLNIYFYYSVINASTTKLLFNLMSLINRAMLSGKKVIIHWVIDEDDEDLMDIGLDLKSVYDLDFRITVR